MVDEPAYASHALPSTSYEVDDGGGGGHADSDMSDVEEVDNIALPSTHRPASLSIADLLVDPKSLADLPFYEYIHFDDHGDVDYRPMFAKLLEQG